MSLFDQIGQALALAPWDHPPVMTRSEQDATLADILARIGASRRAAARSVPTSDALAVPAVFRAVTLLSNLGGSLTLRSYRNNVELRGDDRPRLTLRPDPFTIPREFLRQTIYSTARYGEYWWWVAARDLDGMAMSLICANPREVTVDPNPNDPRYPIIKWRGQRMANADMIQGKMTGDVGALRGEGPLQRCGAAVSVAVEAQEWAANFYDKGGATSLWAKVTVGMTPAQIATFKDTWAANENNELRVTDDTVEDIKDVAPNQSAAQMLEARGFQVGEVVRMFGLPGSFLEYAISGSSLTYQNIGQEFEQLVNVCLAPDYLETIEQTMSDLLPRSTTCRFNTQSLTRADIKTLYEVATTGYDGGNGIIDRAEARAIVGIEPSIETAPVPFSPPSAVPDTLPVMRVLPEPKEVRCTNERTVGGKLKACGTWLGRLVEGSEAHCHKCGGTVLVAA